MKYDKYKVYRHKNTHHFLLSRKNNCPLNGNCQIDNVIYNALVNNNNPISRKTYISLTELIFKQRDTQDKSTLNDKNIEKAQNC